MVGRFRGGDCLSVTALLLLAARPKGAIRPVHAVEFIEDEMGIVVDDRTLCRRFKTSDTDLDVTDPQLFEGVPPDEQCAACTMFNPTDAGRQWKVVT
jgi:hypothetical protein